MPVLKLSLFSYPSIPETGENPAALLIGGSDNIIITALNGSRLQTLKQLDSNGTHGLDFNHKEESVCWVTSSESSGQLRCARMRKASGFTKEQEVKTVQNLHGMIPVKLSYIENTIHWKKPDALILMVDETKGDDKIYGCAQFWAESALEIPIQFKQDAEFEFHGI